LEKEEVLVDKTKYLMLSGAEKFSFRRIRFVLGWGSKPKLDNGLETNYHEIYFMSHTVKLWESN